MFAGVVDMRAETHTAGWRSDDAVLEVEPVEQRTAVIIRDIDDHHSGAELSFHGSDQLEAPLEQRLLEQCGQ